MRLITDDERRSRLGRRHALAHPVETVEEAARAVVALHGTDPASTCLASLARSTAEIDDLQAALYRDRSLVRVLAMRRTVFAVTADLVSTIWAASGDLVAAEQRRRLGRMLVASGITDDPDPWMDRAEAAAMRAFGDRHDVTSADLVDADPMLARRVDIGSGDYTASPTVASRLLTVLSADGRVVRAEPRGGWTSSQFRWARSEVWCGDLGPRPDATDAAVELARRWLHAYGPAHADDLQWWTGWTKTRTKAALAGLDVTEVQMSDRPGLVLADDADPVDAPAPWIALLPALDPSTMGWKHRDFLLGPHRELLFDVNGNGGPTVWADGRIVGGWAHRDDGEVAFELLEDLGRETAAQVESAAADLADVLGEVRLKARARGWTPLEQRLRS